MQPKLVLALPLLIVTFLASYRFPTSHTCLLHNVCPNILRAHEIMKSITMEKESPIIIKFMDVDFVGGSKRRIFISKYMFILASSRMSWSSKRLHCSIFKAI